MNNEITNTTEGVSTKTSVNETEMSKREKLLEEHRIRQEERKQKLISGYSHLLDDYNGRLDELYDCLDEYRRVVEDICFDGGIHDCYSLMEYIEDELEVV